MRHAGGKIAHRFGGSAFKLFGGAFAFGGNVADHRERPALEGDCLHFQRSLFRRGERHFVFGGFTEGDFDFRKRFRRRIAVDRVAFEIVENRAFVHRIEDHFKKRNLFSDKPVLLAQFRRIELVYVLQHRLEERFHNSR